VVEVDAAKEAFFTNFAIYDAYGEGNANFQAGLNDADPTGAWEAISGVFFFTLIDLAQLAINSAPWTRNFQSTFKPHTIPVF
jgi:hypothetical protein